MPPVLVSLLRYCRFPAAASVVVSRRRAARLASRVRLQGPEYLKKWRVVSAYLPIPLQYNLPDPHPPQSINRPTITCTILAVKRRSGSSGPVRIWSYKGFSTGVTDPLDKKDICSL